MKSLDLARRNGQPVKKRDVPEGETKIATDQRGRNLEKSVCPQTGDGNPRTKARFGEKKKKKKHGDTGRDKPSGLKRGKGCKFWTTSANRKKEGHSFPSTPPMTRQCLQGQRG